MCRKKFCLIFVVLAMFLLGGAAQAALIQDLDATIPASVTGSPVTEWADQSGNGNNAVNADGNIYYPSISVSPSGLAGLDMGPTANSLQLFSTQSDGWLNQNSGNGFCVLVAFKCDALMTGDHNDVIGNASAALTEGWGMRYDTVGVLKAYLNGTTVTGAGTVAAGDTIVMACNYDQSTGLYEFWNSKGGTITSTTVAAADFTLANPVTVGKTTNGARFMIGMVGEVRVFDTVLDASAFQLERDTMVATWIEGYHLIPSPGNGATGVSINADLAWSTGAYATSYDVYFGTNPTPGAGEFKGNQTETTYDLPQLELGTTYYWRVDEVDVGNPESPWVGDVWSFETQLNTATLRKGPYLIYPGNNTEMTVLWQLDSGEVCSIEWGLDTSYSSGSASVPEYGTDRQYKHTITGLTPGAKYYYKCNIGAGASTGSFTAAPSDSATDVKFLMGGDRQGQSNTDRWEISSGLVNSIMAAEPAYQSVLLFAGDMVGNGDDEVMQDDQWFNRTLASPLEMMAKIPIQSCQGNHESSGAGFQKYWPYPYVGDRYWSFDYGPVHVAVLNLDEGQEPYTPGSAQHNWLTNDLATTSKPFKIILAHHPAWGAGSHGNEADIQTYIHPLAVQYGVQMYVNGHNHNYARAVVDGIHYVTSGGFGASSYNVNPSADYVVVAIETMNLQKVDVSGNVMTVTSLDMGETVIDSFQIVASDCGDGTCDPGEECSCPADCGSPPSTETNCTDGSDNDCDGTSDCADIDCNQDPACKCGNGMCDTGEDCNSCSEDCISRTAPPKLAYCCGDGTCEGAENETNCAVDCGGGSYCDDGTCDPGEDQCNCPQDCGTPPSNETVCDDGIDEDCDGSEDCDDVDCLGDPACPSCGDATCDPGEDQCNCPADCGTPPSTETNCTDGIDEDCDGSADCDDPTGDCDLDPACDCAAVGEACTTDADCCSNNCFERKGYCKN